MPPSQSLSAALLLLPLRVDPIYLATVPLVTAFAAKLWDGKLQLEVMALAYEALCKKDAATTGLRWTSCLGPIAGDALGIATNWLAVVFAQAAHD